MAEASFADLLTALGIVFLGAMLFLTLRKQNEKMALTALGVYILEAALLAVSRAEAFSLLRISQEYAAAASPALQAMGQVAFESNFQNKNLCKLIWKCLTMNLLF